MPSTRMPGIPYPGPRAANVPRSPPANPWNVEIAQELLRRRHHLVHVGELRRAVLLAERRRTLGHHVAHRRELGARDLLLGEQLRVPMGDSSAADEPELQHP